MSFCLSQNSSYKYFRFGSRYPGFSMQDDVRRVQDNRRSNKYNLQPHIWHWNGVPIQDTIEL